LDDLTEQRLDAVMEHKTDNLKEGKLDFATVQQTDYKQENWLDYLKGMSMVGKKGKASACQTADSMAPH